MWNTGTVNAHAVYAYHGDDFAWVDSTHDHLDVQDMECDGNNAFAQGTYGNWIAVTVYDTNGCAYGWGHGDGIDFFRFRVCEQNGVCSAWKTVT